MSEATPPTGDTDITQAYAALILWVQSTTIRITAIEELMREKLNISDAEWEEALKKAADLTPLPSLKLEGLAAIADFLKGATGRQ